MNSKIFVAACFCCSIGLTAYASENQATAVPVKQNVPTKQNNMEAAIDHLNKAKALLGLSQPGARPDRDTIGQINKARMSLEAADDNKGGHRVNAIKMVNHVVKADTNANAGKLIDQVIDEVKKGIAFAENTAIQKAAEKAKPPVQKDMIAAIEHLEKAKAILATAKTGSKLDKDVVEQLNRAKTKLEQAAPNKGGHREKAIGLINQAVKASTPDTAVKLTDLAIEEVKMGIAFAEKRGK